MNMQHGFAAWLVRHAAASAPPSLAERLVEEWSADLQARRSFISRLLFGLGCCWAVQTIAREFPSGVIAATAANGNVATASAGFHAPPRWSQRPGAMTVIIAAHVVVIYTFANLFNTTPPAKAPPIIHGKVITIPPEKNPPPPVLKVHFGPASLGPIPLSPFAFPADTPRITLPPGTPDIGGGAQAVRTVVIPGGPGAGFPTAEEHYPPSAKRLGEQGSAAVRVCVDPSGRLTELPTVAQSAGSPRLDAGAIELARAGSGHYRPAKENGRAVGSCFAFKVTFRLQS